MLPQLYDAHLGQHMQDLPFWLELAAQVGGPLLELGCGTGRLLIPLAQAGSKCVGLDHDLQILRFLRERSALPVSANLAIIAADVTCFHLAVQFPLITFPCNTYSSLVAVQRKACLRCVCHHLLPGGTFAVSLPNPELLRQMPARSGLEFEEEFIYPPTGNPVQVSSAWQRKKNELEVTWFYDQLFSDGTVQRSTMRILHQLVTLQTYLDEFQAAGLTIRSLFGDFDRSPYTSKSPDLIIVATA